MIVNFSAILYPSVISFCWFMIRHLFEILLIHFPSGMFGIWIQCCRGFFHCSGGKSNVYKSISSQCILFIMISYQFIVTDYICLLFSSLYFMMEQKNGVVARKEVMILACFWKFRGERSLFNFFSLFCSFLF